MTSPLHILCSYPDIYEQIKYSFLPVFHFLSTIHLASCPDSWEVWSDRCLYTDTSFTGTWYTAQDECVTQGGSLLAVTSETENNDIVAVIVVSGQSFLALNCDDLDEEGTWICDGIADWTQYWKSEINNGYWSD